MFTCVLFSVGIFGPISLALTPHQSQLVCLVALWQYPHLNSGSWTEWWQRFCSLTRAIIHTLQNFWWNIRNQRSTLLWCFSSAFWRTNSSQNLLLQHFLFLLSFQLLRFSFLHLRTATRGQDWPQYTGSSSGFGSAAGGKKAEPLGAAPPRGRRSLLHLKQWLNLTNWTIKCKQRKSKIASYQHLKTANLFPTKFKKPILIIVTSWHFQAIFFFLYDRKVN